MEDLGEFSLLCRGIEGGVIDRKGYFCVVEEFIDGWNLDEYEDNRKFGNAVIKLKNVLDSDENFRIISESEGITRQEVQAFFKKITLQREGL